MAAKSYDDFAHAIRLKLLREIRGAPLAEAQPPASGTGQGQRAVASGATP